VVWEMMRDGVVKNNVLAKPKNPIAKAKGAGIPAFYSPYYYDTEYKDWENINLINNVTFERKMFTRGERGYEVVISNDATAALGEAACKSALTNYMFIARESITAEEALSRLS
jgi:hypothetical protein